MNKNDVKKIGWILIFLSIIGIFIDGKIGILIMILIVLIDYILYVKFYQNIYIQFGQNKEGIKLPILGAGLSLVYCGDRTLFYKYDLLEYLFPVIIIFIILIIPLAIKNKKITDKKMRMNKVLVLIWMFSISYIMVFQIHLLLTFDKPEYRAMIITDKNETLSGGDYKTKEYYLHGVWNGEETSFHVPRAIYDNTSIRDVVFVNVEKSILGLEYYSISY